MTEKREIIASIKVEGGPRFCVDGQGIFLIQDEKQILEVSWKQVFILHFVNYPDRESHLAEQFEMMLKREGVDENHTANIRELAQDLAKAALGELK